MLSYRGFCSVGWWEGLIFARCLWNHFCSGNSRCSASLSISHQIGHKNVLQMWGTCLTYTQYEANKAESQSQFIIPFIEPILKSWFVHWWRHADFCVIYRVAHVVFFSSCSGLQERLLPFKKPFKFKNLCVCYFLWMCVHLPRWHFNSWACLMLRNI